MPWESPPTRDEGLWCNVTDDRSEPPKDRGVDAHPLALELDRAGALLLRRSAANALLLATGCGAFVPVRKISIAERAELEAMPIVKRAGPPAGSFRALGGVVGHSRRGRRCSTSSVRRSGKGRNRTADLR